MGSTYGSIRSDRTEVRSRFSPPKRSGYKYQPPRPFHGAKGGKLNSFTTSQSRAQRPSNAVRRYWRCQSANHLANDCPQGRETRPPARYSNRTQVNACAVPPPNCQAGVNVAALCDSGSQIPVLSSRLFKVSDERMLGTVNLQVLLVVL